MKKPLLLLWVVFYCIVLKGQELPDIIPPSPTVANLMKFEEVPVNNYTGQPNISIPLFSKQVAKNTLFDISLQYSTMSVQIDNKSGWVGTGWSLFAGGSISRTVRDVPDETIKGTNGNKTGILHNTNYWNYNTLTTNKKEEYKWKVMGSSVDKYDSQLDLYQFNFMGHTGRFVVAKSGNNLEVKLISRTIAFDVNIDFNVETYSINGFTITDANGYKYIFNVIEKTTSLFSTGIVPQGGVANENTLDNESFQATTAWHLKEIKTPQNMVLLSFDYTPPTQVSYSTAPIRTEYRINSINGANYNQVIRNSYNRGILKPKISIRQSLSTTYERKLSSVNFKDGISIILIQSEGHPELGGGTKLQDIVIQNTDGREQKRYHFIYETIADRLWLSKVSEIAESKILDTKLSYYNSHLLPTFGNGYSQADSWGYYSGIDNDYTASNLFDPNQIKTGLLTRITYPTGGVKEFEFENNTYSYIGNADISIDDYMENPINTSYSTRWAYNYTYTHLTSSSPDHIATDSFLGFTLNFEQDVLISSFIDYTNSNTSYLNNHEIWLEDINGAFYGRIPLAQTGVKISNLPAGTYKLMFAPKALEVSSQYNIKANFSVQYKTQNSNIKREMLGGGARIKNIAFKSSSSGNPVKRIKYEYQNEGNLPVKSSGVIDGDIDKFERSQNIQDDHYLFNDSDMASSKFNRRRVNYSATVKGKNVQMTQGNYIGYRYVKVSEYSYEGLTPVSSGYSTYKYTTAYDYNTPVSHLGLFPLPEPLPNIDYKRGVLLKQQIYDKSNRILKDVTNTNNYLEEFLYKERSPYIYSSVTKQFNNLYDFYARGIPEPSLVPICGGFPCLPLNADVTHIGIGSFIPEALIDFNLGWAQLKETTTKDYYYEDESTTDATVVETKKTYDYNTTNYQIATENSYVKEKGVDVRYETKYYYPTRENLTSNSPVIINRLLALNKVNEILETVSKRYVGTDLTGTILNKTHIIYNIVNENPNTVLPAEIKVGKGTLTPEPKVEYIKYDIYNNPLEVSQKNGTHIVYLWGYNGSVPVAKIENITYEQIEALPVFGDNFTITTTLSNAQQTALREMNNTMVTTFKYNSNMKIENITDARGATVYYEYDDFNRLVRVKDQEGNVVTEHSYNYKNNN